MTITAVSTAYLGSAFLPSVNQADAQLAQLEIETTTGQYADLGTRLGESSGYELSLRNTDDLLQSLTTANAITAGRLSTSTSALSSLISSANSTVQSLVGWSPETTEQFTLGSTGDDAMTSLQQFANASYDNQYVFGGINSGTPPLATFSTTAPGPAAALAAFQTQFGILPTDAGANQITAAQMTSFLSGAFASGFTGTNWTTNWSSASSTNTTAEISPGETIQTSTNLNAGGFQPLAQAYTMLALFGGSNLSDGAKQAVATAATTLINQGLSQLTTVGSTVGQMQNQVSQADEDMSTQQILMKTQIGGLDNINPSLVATELNSLTTQLESAYQATAQLQKLNLAQYLPT